MRTIDGGVVALGVTLIGASIGFSWKAANLKSDIVNNFNTRVAIAQAGLDERAASLLRLLARRVNQVLGDLNRFNPDEALSDPSELQGYVETVSKVLTARRKLPDYFARMLAVGPRLLVLFGTLDVSLLVAFSYFTGFNRARTIGFVGMWTSIFASLIACALCIHYFVTLHRFAGAEVLSIGEEAHE
jgi:hypothetical protein